MSKMFFDTEFIENPSRKTIQLLSIGIVCDDGRELYLESSDANRSEGNPWVQENVIPHLQGKGIPDKQIGDEILDFVGNEKYPQFWAYFSSRDWLLFCWLFEPDFPRYFPKFCRDFRQTMQDYGIKKKHLPAKPKNAHNALADARWLRDAYFQVCS